MDCPQSQHRPHSAPRRSPSCGCDGSNSDPEIGHGSVAVDTMWDYHGGYIYSILYIYMVFIYMVYIYRVIIYSVCIYIYGTGNSHYIIINFYFGEMRVLNHRSPCH